MRPSAEFFLRGDPVEFLFIDQAHADSAVMIRQVQGRATVSDGHSTVVRDYAKVLLDRAVQIVAQRYSILSPLIHGLESDGTACIPTALVVRPRGAAIIMSLDAAESVIRIHNHQPVLRHD